MEKLTLPEPAAGLWAAKRSIVLAIPPATRSQPSPTTRAIQPGAPMAGRPVAASSHQGNAMRRTPACCPGTTRAARVPTTPGAGPEKGTPRKSRPAGSRSSKPSGTTRHKSHSSRHIPRNTRALGAEPRDWSEVTLSDPGPGRKTPGPQTARADEPHSRAGRGRSGSIFPCGEGSTRRGALGNETATRRPAGGQDLHCRKARKDPRHRNHRQHPQRRNTSNQRALDVRTRLLEFG